MVIYFIAYNSHSRLIKYREYRKVVQKARPNNKISYFNHQEYKHNRIELDALI
jgi:hypothetical protein